MASAKCGRCGHEAELSAPADAWKCNCAAGVGPDGCDCDAVNEQPGTEDNSNDPAEQEVAQLEARLSELRGRVHQIEVGGGIGPKGETNG